MTTLGTLLKNPPIDPLETRILLAYALGLSRAQLITQSERVLTNEETQQLAMLFQRRMAGEPIAYIVGEREFYGLSFEVTPAVLIPRPDTELLVELALERLPTHGRLLDLGTGSGAIAIAIAHHRPDAHVTALDVSEAALEVARRNAARHCTDIRFLHSHWYRTLHNDERFDVIAANPPYIHANDAHLSQGDLRFEPKNALTDHSDGLSALHEIVSKAKSHLLRSGWLLVEHGYDQGNAVRSLLSAHGFQNSQSWKDLAGHERVSGSQ